MRFFREPIPSQRILRQKPRRRKRNQDAENKANEPRSMSFDFRPWGPMITKADRGAAQIKARVPATSRVATSDSEQYVFLNTSGFMTPLPTIFQTISELASQYFVWLLLVSGLLFAGSLTIAWLLILRLPADYLCRPDTTNCHQKQTSNLLHFLRKLIQNCVGFALLICGFVMLFTPGQGLLFMLLGVTLMDIPYKHKITRHLARRKGILKIINRIRSKRGKQVLTTEPQPR